MVTCVIKTNGVLKKMKIIAFYLPQFHVINENNEWWGNGFTEWTNTKKSKPLFKDHYQPREPLGDNYYNLLDDEVKKWQVKLAKNNGVYGFCFYHYWFKDGKKLLEKPIEQYLKNKELDLPFCLSWANEPWSRRWDGSEHKVLMPQEYGGQDEWKDHFNYLLPFFKDKRYITSVGKPIFIIYKPDIIPCLNEMIDFWQDLAKYNGLQGISFVYQYPNFHLDMNKDDSRFDMAIEFEPMYSLTRSRFNKKTSEKIKELHELYRLNFKAFFNRSKQIINGLMDRNLSPKLSFRFTVTDIRDYDVLVNKSITNMPVTEKAVPGVFTNWDNTPRRGQNATLFIGSTPKKFKEYLSIQIKRAKEIYKKDMIFVNAWNEWAEGAYLEPDKKYGYAYLQAVKDALIENGEFNEIDIVEK